MVDFNLYSNDFDMPSVFPETQSSSLLVRSADFLVLPGSIDNSEENDALEGFG